MRVVVVGTAIIAACIHRRGRYERHLTDVRQLKRPRTPAIKPEPVWFQPF